MKSIKSIEAAERKAERKLHASVGESMLLQNMVCEFFNKKDSMTLQDYARLLRSAKAASKKAISKS
jgi:hypothetical protein